MEQLTRSMLFKLVAAESNEQLIKSIFKEPNTILELFNQSSIFISFFESRILKDTSYRYSDLFNEMFYENIQKIQDIHFRNYLYKEYDKLKFQNKNKLWTFRDYFNHLIRIIAKYHSKIISNLYIGYNEDNRKTIKPPLMPQTFLSYAYDDKGVTLGLYLYFLNNGGFLYVDWMWHGELHGVKIKNSIYHELLNSSQFLFLRSPSSELETGQGERMIRQWCSWEIGNYFNLKDNKKYFTNFYKAKKPTNEILCDFDQAYYVSNGLIY